MPAIGAGMPTRLTVSNHFEKLLFPSAQAFVGSFRLPLVTFLGSLLTKIVTSSLTEKCRRQTEPTLHPG
jgi:hypothetical protein